MTKRQLALRGGVVLSSLSLTCIGLVALELYASSRIRDTGWNYRGYRGPVLGAKQPHEVRIFALGASTTYGYGVRAQESYPARLQEKLRQANPLPGQTITVVNLGMLADPAVCLEANLRDYEYLHPDLVMIYAGYNQGGTTERNCYRQSNPVFRALKIFPVSPIALREKWYRIRYGDVATGYLRHRKEPLGPQEIGEEVPTPLNVEQLRLLEQYGERAGALEAFRSFEPEYQRYERAILHLIETALAKKLGVLFVYQVDLGRGYHQYQQWRIRRALQRYQSHPLFRTANASQLFHSKVTPEFFSTWMHLNRMGNDRLAQLIQPSLIDLLRAWSASRTATRFGQIARR